MFKRIVVILMMIGSCFACNSQASQEDVFCSHFGEKLNLPGKETDIFVLVINRQGCNLCYNNITESLRLLDADITEIFILISDKSGSINDYKFIFERYPDKVFLDTENILPRIELPIVSSGILYIKDRQVQNGMEYNSQNAADGLLKFVEDFKTASY